VTTSAPARPWARKNEYVPVGDQRVPIRASVVADAISRAGAAVAETAGERFVMPEAFTEMRRFFHSISDAGRRLVILKLLIEESARIAHDRGASWYNP
jgi:hypothetical protein